RGVPLTPASSHGESELQPTPRTHTGFEDSFRARGSAASTRTTAVSASGATSSSLSGVAIGGDRITSSASIFAPYAARSFVSAFWRFFATTDAHALSVTPLDRRYASISRPAT